MEVEGSDDDADATDDAAESSSDDEAAENDAVVVRWGKKEYDAVVLEVKSRAASRSWAV